MANKQKTVNHAKVKKTSTEVKEPVISRFGFLKETVNTMHEMAQDEAWNYLIQSCGLNESESAIMDGQMSLFKDIQLYDLLSHSAEEKDLLKEYMPVVEKYFHDLIVAYLPVAKILAECVAKESTLVAEHWKAEMEQINAADSNAKG